MRARKKHWPVVFAHGLGIPAFVYEYLIPMKALFGRYGFDLRVARTPISGTVEDRAKCLRDEIARLVPSGDYHLIGHSLGGLDARLAIHRYELGTRDPLRTGLESRCVSLTTIATPHRGSPVAERIMRGMKRQDRLLGHLAKLMGGHPPVLRQLMPSSMEAFNQTVENHLGVRYFSLGFYIPEPVQFYSRVPWLWILHGMLKDAGEPENDALVGTRSAAWGEYLGSLTGDHYSQAAPVPFAGDYTYRDVFRKVLQHLKLLERDVAHAFGEGAAAKPDWTKSWPGLPWVRPAFARESEMILVS